MRFIFAAIAASTLASLSTGCFLPLLGCDDGASIVDTSPADLGSFSVVARSVPSCAVSSPFAGGFDLEIDTPAATIPILTISIARSVVLYDTIPLHVGDATPEAAVQVGDTDSGLVRLVYTPNADAPDAMPIAAAIVTLSAVPVADGDPLEVELEIHFIDGRVLDRTFSAPVTATSECPVS